MNDSDRNEDRPSYSELIKPPPYPLDEALEAAYAPLPVNPGHTSDDWETEQGQPQRATGQSDSAQGYSEGNETGHQSGDTGLPGGTDPGKGVECGATGLVTGRPKLFDPVFPRVRADTEPTAMERLAQLPLWQSRYCIALRELGGNVWLACQRCEISRRSVQKHAAQSQDFAAAIREAIEDSTDLVEAAIFRGATIGDQRPVWHQGVLVGYERRRNVKDAELLLRLRKRISNRGEGMDGALEPVQGSVTPTEAGTIIGSLMKELFSGPKGRPESVPAEIVE